MIRQLIAAVQRAVRGYSYLDTKDANAYLAGLVANMITDLARAESIPSRFVVNDNLLEAKSLQRAEYATYADIFRRYQLGGVWQYEEEARSFSGVTDYEMSDALVWLANNWYDLWD